jgi:TorA maturation chaperone TorD
MSGADTAANHAPLDASAFVAPRNLLARPALSALDKEQIDGLVGMAASLDARADSDMEAEDYPRLFEGPDELRCAAHQLPPDCPGHGAAGQKEPEYIEPKW